MMSTEQVLVWSAVQPNAPGPSAPAGSVAHVLPLLVPVCSVSTWSYEEAGSGFGGYGGGDAKEVPCFVALSHSHAEIVNATVSAVAGAPHSAWAQACTLV